MANNENRCLISEEPEGLSWPFLFEAVTIETSQLLLLEIEPNDYSAQDNTGPSSN